MYSVFLSASRCLCVFFRGVHIYICVCIYVFSSSRWGEEKCIYWQDGLGEAGQNTGIRFSWEKLFLQCCGISTFIVPGRTGSLTLGATHVPIVFIFVLLC